MPTYEEVIGELADQSTYDPFERAAARTRFGAKPLGGRQEGVATTLPENILFAAPRAAAGFAQAAFDRAAEEHGGVPQISTDYDPRRVAGYLGAETALNTTGFGTPFSQASALGSAGGKAVMGQLAEQAPPFYSAVERAVQGAKQNVAPGQQWAGYLRNQPGVKPEEIEALQLGKLFEQPGALPRQTVLDQIAANRVNVGEVVKSEKRTSETGRTIFQDRDEAALARYQAPYDRLASEQKRFIDDELASRSPTKFQQYTLPGGENYREMLLTLPEKRTGANAQYDAIAAKARSEGRQLTPEEISQRNALEATIKGQGEFKSGHYDEPNIIAHVRYNDRVIDGKKTLFVEEVQSDWHQKGREKGYGSIDTKGWQIGERRQNENAITSRVQVLDENGRHIDTIDAPNGWSNEQVIQAARDLQDKGGRVPDAPFKTTWPELAMKRIIREAAEKGYDKVAWTPGSVQAARYDLSKQVDAIQVHPRTDAVTGEKTRSLLIQLPNGHAWSVGVNKEGIIDNVGASNQAMKGKRLDEVIGKDLADKIMATEGQAKLSGLDLQVGGEGMKGFYDEILPATVNKLVKKHGGRVQQTDMTAATAASPERVHTIDITPSLREQALKKGFPLFTLGGGTAVMGGLAAQDEYQ